MSFCVGKAWESLCVQIRNVALRGITHQQWAKVILEISLASPVFLRWCSRDAPNSADGMSPQLKAQWRTLNTVQ